MMTKWKTKDTLSYRGKSFQIWHADFINIDFDAVHGVSSLVFQLGNAQMSIVTFRKLQSGGAKGTFGMLVYSRVVYIAREWCVYIIIYHRYLWQRFYCRTLSLS